MIGRKNKDFVIKSCLPIDLRGLPKIPEISIKDRRKSHLVFNKTLEHLKNIRVPKDSQATLNTRARESALFS